MQSDPEKHIEKTGWKELGWFVGLWVCGVTTILIIGGLIKIVL